MARDNQYSPNQSGSDTLAFCQTARKVLVANINPFDSLESKIEAKAKIMSMDYNELRAEMIRLSKPATA